MSNRMLTFSQQNEGQTPALYNVDRGGVSIGLLMQDVDGFYYYWPSPGNGSWAAYSLLDSARQLSLLNYSERSCIATKLDALDEPWRKKIAEELT